MSSTNLLLSVSTLAFVLGFIGSLLKSDLHLPEVVFNTISMYLLFAIGLEGGAGFDVGESTTGLLVIAAGIALSVAIVPVSLLFSKLLKVGTQVDRYAIAAHYASVSAVTFVAASGVMHNLAWKVPSYAPALVAVLELPGIFLALALAKKISTSGSDASAHTVPDTDWLKILTGKSVLLLLGGFFIGLLVGVKGLADVKAFFVDPFRGIQSFFLLELGAMAGTRAREIRREFLQILTLGILTSLAGGLMGVGLGKLAHFDREVVFLLGVLGASSSYIAAPAAVRTALPQAHIGRCMALSLGVTFPFVLLVIIPLFSQWL